MTMLQMTKIIFLTKTEKKKKMQVNKQAELTKREEKILGETERSQGMREVKTNLRSSQVNPDKKERREIIFHQLDMALFQRNPPREISTKTMTLR